MRIVLSWCAIMTGFFFPSSLIPEGSYFSGAKILFVFQPVKKMGEKGKKVAWLLYYILLTQREVSHERPYYPCVGERTGG